MLKQHQSSSSPSSSRKPAFFSIPNLKPLLPSYNVPKPVFEPPETAPYPFLNSNPHCIEFPEKLSPMDVDPCVLLASQTETPVTRTTDLTASEQAGVALSEPTMVSTTSESPANSVCNVSCNSENEFKKHREAHINNTQKQEIPLGFVDETSDQESEKKNQDLVSSPMKQDTQSLDQESEKNFQDLGSSPMKQDTQSLDQEFEKKNQDLVSSPIKQDAQSLDQESEKKNQDLFSYHIKEDTQSLDQESVEKKQNLLSNEGSINSLFVCSIPDPGCDYQKVVTEQCGYIPQQVTGPSCKPKSAGTTPVQPSNGGAQKGRAKQSLWCDVCKVGCTGEKNFERHILGKQHLKNLEFSEKLLTRPLITGSKDITPVKSPMEDLKSSDSEIGDSEERMTTWCQICKINCTPGNGFIRHVSGRRHKMNLQNLNDTAEKLKSMKGKVVDSNNDNSTSCDLCSVRCTSVAELNQHIKGKKHQKKLNNTEKVFGDTPALVAKQALQDPITEKGKVVILEGSKRKGSLSSDEDGDTKRQKMMKEDEACTVACKLCNVVCKGLMAFKTHLAGSEHSTMVLNQVNGGSSKQDT